MSIYDKDHIERCRHMTIGEKWLLLDQYYRLARQLHAAYVRLSNPRATEYDVTTEWLRATLDRELFDEVQEYRWRLRESQAPECSL